MTMYLHRLAIYKLASQEVIVSVFLPLAPMGQGGYAAMQLGSEVLNVFPETKTLHPMAGEVLSVLGWMTAMILWGFGLVSLFFAIASMSRSKSPFNMGWWGFTFPMMFSMSRVTMGQELPSAFFMVLKTVLSISVMLLWLVMAAGTIKKILYGNLLCFREIEKASAALNREATPGYVIRVKQCNLYIFPCRLPSTLGSRILKAPSLWPTIYMLRATAQTPTNIG
jgi:tellurite resistance protein TehA-like permease